MSSGTLARPAAFFAATLLLLAALQIHAEIHLDTARDLLIARDCTLGRHCPEAGPRSSFAGLMHGALWSHALELRERLGLGVAAFERVVAVALALAAALVPVAARPLGRHAGACAWALWLALTLITTSYPTLWNPTLWPLALALLTLALAWTARGRGTLAALALAAALAASLGLHASSALLVPFALAAIVACARRPLVAVPLASALLLALLALDAPKGFTENRGLLAAHKAALLLVLAASVALGALARPRLSALPDALRAERVLAALCLALLALWPLGAWLSGHGLQARYLAPLATPAAILVGARLDRSPALRRLTLAGVLLGYLAFWADDRWSDRRLRVFEAEAIAAELYGRGLGFGDLYRRLRGPDAFALLSTLAAFEPPDGRAATGEPRDLVVLPLAREALPSPLPPGWSAVPLGGGRVALIAASLPRLDLDALELCRDGACAPQPVDGRRFDQHPDMVWNIRAHAPLAPRGRDGERWVYRLPVRPAAGQPRELVLLRDECAGWTIETSDAGHRLELRPDARAASFAVAAAPRCRGWLPPYVEADPPLARLLEPTTLPGR